MASWTNDSELAPQQSFSPPTPAWHPDWRSILVSVAISVPVTIVTCYVLVQLAFHFCWGCAGGL